MTGLVEPVAYCEDCGERYKSPRFPDLVIPHADFAKIASNPPDGGLFCPNCLLARLSMAGIETSGSFTSGPLAPDPTLTPYALIVAPYASATRMVRDAIGELFGPVASIESEEATLLRGPEPHHEAEAQIAALDRVLSQLQVAEAERDSWRRVAERCRSEAVGHAMEAETANNTIYRIYQAITGSKGEPGNWNGAQPVIEYVRAAEAEVSKLKAQVEWQPIETAPRDGRKVDLWASFEKSGWRRVSDAHWNATLGDWQLGQYNASDYMTRPEITHWRPLPAPPTQSRALSDEVNDGQ